MPGGADKWRISPAIPTIANCALAALWAFSALGGWGETAFCGEGGRHDPSCAGGFTTAVLASLVAAVPAALIAVMAWTLPAVRRNTVRLEAALATAALLWVAAEGVLFVGGSLAQS
ncbi:hypothetical protein SAMN04489712_1561 [Thermomonospora echinospora]|uniref:Uncharacterized protein n=2 Tax=Thermomonospora echinospora TaxID=1992 RepID=A0A1H6EDA8_9ACTN|nr:hypothetical protein SAMN04489712_1561 [Thermomonospora echinospora]